MTTVTEVCGRGRGATSFALRILNGSGGTDSHLQVHVCQPLVNAETPPGDYGRVLIVNLYGIMMPE